MADYTFIYFPVRGKGEFIRYLFHHAGIPFEDKQISFEEWPKVKPTTPMGLLPVLKCKGGHELHQSCAIARFVAREAGLLGDDSVSMAKADMVVDDVYDDLYRPYEPSYISVYEGKSKEDVDRHYSKFKTATLIPFITKYEKFLTENATGYFVGNKLTWADIIVAEFLNRLMVCFDPSVFSGFDHLKKHHDMVHALPTIQKYVNSRPAYTF